MQPIPITMKNNLQPLFVLNFAALCISSSGVLGSLMTLPAALTILLRCFVAIFFLFLFSKLSRASLKIDYKNHKGYFFGSGALLAIHWVTYFYAIQLSGVAVAMISLFSYPVITTLLEPLFFKNRITLRNFLASIVVLLGLYFIVPDFDMANTRTTGALWGIFSALCYALRNLMNKNYVKIYSGSVIMFYQLWVAAILLSPVLFFFPLDIGWTNTAYLLTLGLITTALGHTLFVRSLQHFTASTASIITGIQPVYGILLAVIFTQEQVSLSTVIGGLLILLTVVVEGLSHYRLSKIDNTAQKS